MNIACSNCPAKYAVPDEKVRGRKVRITCKRCGAGIVVDGTKLVPQPEAGPASGRERHSTKVGGLEAPQEPPQSAAARGAAVAAPAPTPPDDDQWTVAVTDDDQREMTLAEIVDAYAAGTIDAETFIWREGMDDWLTPYEIPVIEAALRQRGLAPRTSAPPEQSGPEPPRPHDQSGAWREPGRWDKGQAQEANVSFDDVTVAMAAPKAQALLEAVAATGPARPAPAAKKSAPEEESTMVAPTRDLMAGLDEPVKDRKAPRPAAGVPTSDPHAAPKPKASMFGRPDTDADGTTRPLGVTARTAARRPEREPEVDLFARRPAHEDDAPRARMPSAPDAPRGRMPSAPDAPRERMPSSPPESAAHAMTGARNESSVLFTLDQLTRPQARPAPKAEKIDANILLAPSPQLTDEQGPPSVAKIGGGGLFPTAAMAAPDFNAPAAPSAPSHPPPPTAALPTAEQPAASSGSSLWVILGILGVIAAGGASYFFVVRTPEPPSAESAAGATQAQAAPVQAAEPNPEMTAAAAADTSSAAPGASGTAAQAATGAPAQAAGGRAPPSGAGAMATVAATGAPTAMGTAPVATGAAPAATAPKPAQPAQPKPSATAQETAPAAAEGPAFDKDSAAQALGAAASTAQTECASQDGPHGNGKVTVTFTNSGRATNALVSGDFAGSALGGCIARVFRGTKVPAFGGDPVRVTKSVHVP